MEQLTLMRRANGELFAIARKGKEYLAVWPSLESALHYKARNPELLVFTPISVTRAFGHKNRIGFPGENTGLLLLTGTTGAHFRDARKISWDEVENRMAAESPTSPLLGLRSLKESEASPVRIDDMDRSPVFVRSTSGALR